MKNRILLLSVVLFFSFEVIGQVSDTAAVRAEVDSLMALVENLAKEQNFEEALLLTETAKQKYLTGFEKKSALYASLILQKGIVYNKKGAFINSEPFFLEALEIQKEVIGTTHPDYAKTCFNLGYLYLRIGKHKQAENYLNETEKLYEKFYGINSVEYSKCTNLQAILNKNIGNFEASEALYIKAMKIVENIFGKEHSAYATSLNNLAVLYYTLGRYEDAEPYLVEAKDIRKRVLGEQHLEYLSSVGNVGLLYATMGKYTEAEKMYLKSLEMFEKLFGKEKTGYPDKLNNLGMMYFQIGMLEKSIAVLTEAAEIFERLIGKENIRYTHAVNNLALSYLRLGNYEKATPLFWEAKEIREKVLGKEHPDYAQSVSNLAYLLKKTGDFEQSEKYYTEAKNIYESKNISCENCYLKLLRGFGNLKAAKEEYAEAEQLIRESITVRKKSSGTKNMPYLEDLIVLFKTLKSAKKIGNALEILEELATLEKDFLIQASTYFSQKELMSYIPLISNSHRGFGSLAYDNENLPEEFYQSYFKNILFQKGYLLQSGQKIHHLGNAAPDSVRQIYLSWKNAHKSLADQYSKPIDEQEEVELLAGNLNKLEKKLIEKLPGFEEANRQITSSDVQKQLLSSEAAVEFLNFKITDSDTFEHRELYGALILLPDSESPRFISLFEEEQLQKLLETTSKKEDFYSDLYASRGLIRKNKKPISKEVYNLIWKPIEPFLKNVKTIHYSPAGLLHQLNLSALPISKTETLGDKYQLNQLSSTRQIVLRDFEEEAYSKKDALVLGGIEYDFKSEVEKADTLQDVFAFASEVGFQNLDRGSLSRGESWKYLPGTAKEANSIHASLKKAGYRSQILSAKAATEEAVKSIGTKSESPRILHFATHGYFFPNPRSSSRRIERSRDKAQNGSNSSEPVFKLSDHPMIRSGLLLAGSNRVWQGAEQIPGKEDGILTAYEISQMNLTNTELVVLSACETGLGDIRGNEGVFGLQRAFKMAGVKYLIMSLWQVPDKQTQELMTLFYKNYLKKKMSIPEAFRAAQQKMRKKYEDPYSWAGFVLVE